MNKGINEVRLSGKMAEGFKTREFNNSTLVTFALESFGTFKEKGGIEKATRSFFDVSCWASVSDAAKYQALFEKGEEVVVIGTLIKESWEDRETKKRRYAVKVKADKIMLRADMPATIDKPATVGEAQEPEPHRSPANHADSDKPAPADVQPTDEDMGVLPF